MHPADGLETDNRLRDRGRPALDAHIFSKENALVPADRLFKTEARPANAKATQTDSASRSIIEVEAAQRRAKTERLKQARIAQEASQPAPEAPVKKTAKPRKKA
jgi:hypothetical protein